MLCSLVLKKFSSVFVGIALRGGEGIGFVGFGDVNVVKLSSNDAVVTGDLYDAVDAGVAGDSGFMKDLNRLLSRSIMEKSG